jgi:hypothetical protein
MPISYPYHCHIDKFKGTESQDFGFWFFSWISFPPAPEYSIRTVSNFFEKSRRYSQVKVHYWHQRHRWQICNRCQRRRWQISTGLNETGWKFATSVNDTGGKQWEQLSNCCQLKMNLKKKICLYANSTTQRCPKEITKIFLIANFFHLPSVSTTPVVHLELRISPQIFEKFETALIRAWGKLMHVENLE